MLLMHWMEISSQHLMLKALQIYLAAKVVPQFSLSRVVLA
ncbi:hypothetical protein A79E_1739 [Klebsiella pneumoniae subsp. pneumoniae 1084]|nr:hypothetical protein A79E_1739 [Klebsiella pneumoniae subsp. pneumoniae 1084]